MPHRGRCHGDTPARGRGRGVGILRGAVRERLSDEVIFAQTTGRNKAESSWIICGCETPETIIINDPTGNLSTEQQTYLCFGGRGREKGALGKHPGYMECIH